MIEALAKMCMSLTAPLSTSLIEEIHDALIIDDTLKIRGFRKKDHPLGAEGATFGITAGNLTKKGIAEFIDHHIQEFNDHGKASPLELKIALKTECTEEEYKNFKTWKRLLHDSEVRDLATSDKSKLEEIKELVFRAASTPGGGVLIYRYADTTEFIEHEIETYQSAITTASTDIDKLRIIVNFVRNCEQLHPFYDGNCRTMYLLLQKLLIENGFSPTSLADPNILDMYDTDELIEEIKTGFERVKTYTHSESTGGLSIPGLEDYYKVLEKYRKEINPSLKLIKTTTNEMQHPFLPVFAQQRIKAKLESLAPSSTSLWKDHAIAIISGEITGETEARAGAGT